MKDRRDVNSSVLHDAPTSVVISSSHSASVVGFKMFVVKTLSHNAQETESSVEAMDSDEDDGTDAFRERLQNRNRRRKPERDEDPSHSNKDDSSQRRRVKRRSERCESIDSHNIRSMDLMVGKSSLQNPATISAGTRFSPLTFTPALFAAREFHDLKNKTGPGILHPVATADLFRPSGSTDYEAMTEMQSTLRGSQEPPALNLLPPVHLLRKLKQLQEEERQLQEQQRRLQEQQLRLQEQRQRQHMQSALISFAPGNVSSYGNPFSPPTNGSTTTTETAGSYGGSLSSQSCLPAASPDRVLHPPTRNGDNGMLDSLLLSLLLQKDEFLQSPLNKTGAGNRPGFDQLAPTRGRQDASLPATITVTGPPIVAGQDWPRKSATPPSSPRRQAASASQFVPDELIVALAESRSPSPHETIPTSENLLYKPCDNNILSEYQILLRKQIEFFIAKQEDIDHFTPNRRKELSVGQVGIRCIHCASLNSNERRRGALYFPFSLSSIYQAAQNMMSDHFDICQKINPALKEQLIGLQETKSVSGNGGKKYWAATAMRRGITETEAGLRFCDR